MGSEEGKTVERSLEFVTLMKLTPSNIVLARRDCRRVNVARENKS